MPEPPASRPFMPGYGVAGPTEGRGLLPWSWAEERLTKSHDYWVSTVRADGRPHLMPVWAVWDGSALWFSSSLGSRKARNLAADRAADRDRQRLGAGRARGLCPLVTDHAALARFIEFENDKYETDYGADFLDPAVNATFRVVPSWVFSLTEDDFTGSPTRWSFSP